MALLPILPLHAQLIITGEHTIEAKNNQFVPLAEAVSGDASAVLNIVGEGQVGLSAASSDFEGEIVIRGADLRLFNQGRLDRAANIVVKEGGSLTWDNAYSGTLDRFSDSGSITLSAGTLNFIVASNISHGGLREDFGPLILSSGANHITVNARNITISPNQIVQTHPTATLEIFSAHYYGLQGDNTKLQVRTPLPSTLLKGGILPWVVATANGNWVTAHTGQNAYWLIPFTNYHTGTPDNWEPKHNVSIVRDSTLETSRTINSLHFIAWHDLTLESGAKLEIQSGGLLTSHRYTSSTRIKGQGTLTSGANTFYAHIYASFNILDEVAFTLINHFVKTGSGVLHFNSNVTHDLGTLTINEGAVYIDRGRLLVDRIVIGDGAGEDLLKISPDHTNAILGKSGRAPSITLHGNPYGPKGDEAIFRIGSNTRQQLAELYIRDRGTIAFDANGRNLSNILYLDSLAFSDTSARLTLRGWKERENYLLVKRSWGDANLPPLLSQIDFEGYRPAIWQPHDLKDFDDYWQITPGGAVPEPATYGAILGAVGLGLVARRRHCRRMRED